ncbi:hypothetical protein BEL04_13855 [Mucilaginibacter sp. PPCGB 2223]|uniref:hypothetical protein n=1 Tax=Mucilaginibacter sp. PPCGB 2223 TaxID=1886027 RepID=UPI0008244135|nr:hypothetical protein [Mucilaginibacter sp. PPCGB 2223]OCX52535.1 hypothetical protein BEL04_13855 [Mucilaginibacter sp. PPCGB 2223]
MRTHTDKTQQHKSQAAADNLPGLKSKDERPHQLGGGEVTLHEKANGSARVKQLQAYQAMANRHLSAAAQRKQNPEKHLPQNQDPSEPPVQMVKKSGLYSVTKEANMRDKDHVEIIKLNSGETVEVNDSVTEGSLFSTRAFNIGKKEHSWSATTALPVNTGWVVDEALTWVGPIVKAEPVPQKGLSKRVKVKKKVVAPVDQPVVVSGAKAPEPVVIKKTPVVKESAVAVSAPAKAVAVVVPQKSFDQQVEEWLAQLNPMNVEHIKAVKKYYQDRKADLRGVTLQRINTFLRVHGLNTEDAATNFIANIEGQFEGADVRDPMVMFSRIMVAVNQSLTALKYPEIAIKRSDSVTGAVFEFKTWEMLVNPGYRAMGTSMATTLYHEARHSEQWFKMIMGQLRKGKKKAEIVSEMTVPGNIVDAAIEKSAAVPVAEINATDIYHQSVYGTGRAKRDEVLTSGKLTDESSKEYKAYRALPEEVDAWDTQDRVGESITARIQDLIDLIPTADEPDIFCLLFNKLEFLCKMDNKTDKLKPVALAKIAKLGVDKMAALKSYERNLLTRLAK